MTSKRNTDVNNNVNLNVKHLLDSGYDASTASNLMVKHCPQKHVICGYSLGTEAQNICFRGEI